MNEDQSRSLHSPGSDELLRLVLESATDIAIFSTDPAGIVTSWNIGAERLLGYAESEIVGRTADVIFTPEDCAAGMPEAERATALARGRAEDERFHLRRDRSCFWGSGLMMPLADPRFGFVKIMRDLTERHAAQERLRQKEERFRVLATNIPQLVFRSRGTGERSWGSPQWEDFAGLSDMASRGFGWLEAIHPDDREETLAAWRKAQEMGEYHAEHRIRRASDGEYRWHQTRAKPLGSSDSTQAEWVGTSTDIHDMRSLQDRQKMLVAELQHRTRNLLAVVQSIARQTLRTSSSLQDFGGEFESRLGALSRAQGLIARADDQAIDLRALVEAELAAHTDGDDDEGKVRVDGPPLPLPASSAQALALAIHELATNAVKHGAFGHAGGRLEVTWRIDDGCVVFEWRESGVTMPSGIRPERTGYGRELIERALPYQLKAETCLEFGSDGVRCSIAAPIGKGPAKHA